MQGVNDVIDLTRPVRGTGLQSQAQIAEVLAVGIVITGKHRLLRKIRVVEEVFQMAAVLDVRGRRQ